MRPALLGVFVGLLVMFLFDIIGPSPVMADVVERHGMAANGTGEVVTVSWLSEDGRQTAEMVVPDEYAGQDRVPVLARALRPHIDDGWLSPGLYVAAAVLGSILWPMVVSLRPPAYSEQPIQQVTSSAGS